MCKRILVLLTVMLLVAASTLRGFEVDAAPEPAVVPQTLTVPTDVGVIVTPRDAFSAHIFAWPVTAPGTAVTSSYGPRVPPTRGASSWHHGIDLSRGAFGDPVVAAAPGVVTTVAYSGRSGYGQYVVVQHTVGAEVFETLYAHLERGNVAVTPGAFVHVGQLIAPMGSSGTSTGPHLHFEVQVDGAAVDPLPWLLSHTTQ